MKRLFITAIALIAFSGVSMANTIEVEKFDNEIQSIELKLFEDIYDLAKFNFENQSVSNLSLSICTPVDGTSALCNLIGLSVQAEARLLGISAEKAFHIGHKAIEACTDGGF